MDNSLWISTDKKKNREKLKGRIEAEVCIIGGGLTGITTGYYLSKQGKEVVILEKNTIGSHTSGNTTGKITSQHGLFYSYLEESMGKDYAREYYNANQEAIRNIKDIIDKDKIECDFEEQDSFVITQDEKDLNKIKDEVRVVNLIGGEAEYVKSFNNVINKLSPIGGIKFSNQAQFNSYKYLNALANIIEENKGKIFENSKVFSVDKEGEGYSIKTEDGEVFAKYVVIASHYPIINFPGFYFMKMYQETSYLIAVETNEELFDGMYITNNEPTISLRTAIYNGKRIAIVGGGKHKTGEERILKYSYNELEKIAKKLFPDAKVLFRWNAEDCITLDKIPYIGEFSKMMPNVFVGTGYKKWGMTTSNIAGKIISDKILGIDNKYEEIFDSRRIKPIKNYKELTNMVKEVGESLVLKRIKKSHKDLKDLNTDEGKIIEIEGEKLGVYKTKDGEIYAIRPFCSHLGCQLTFNDLDKTWDCPCHGSKFNYKGENLYDPGIKNLEFTKIEE